MKLVNVQEMLLIEKEANSIGLTYDLMMQNAGVNLAKAVETEFEQLKHKGILGLVGSGNNGGDTLVALTYLKERGWDCAAYIIRLRPSNDKLTSKFEEVGGDVILHKNDPLLEKLSQIIQNSAILMDGVLGTGIKLPLKTELAEIFKEINHIISGITPKPIVIAVDCPSGVDCDNGDAAKECIPADLTITMAAYKQGLLKFPAYNFVGDLKLVEIGLPQGGNALNSWISVSRFVPDIPWVTAVLPSRPLDSHKGTYGTSLVVAGSEYYTGAVFLAGKAAYRIGTGLVTLAVPRSINKALAGHIPEATWLPLPEEGGFISSDAVDIILENLDKATSVLIGPGFGLKNTTAEFVRNFLEGGKDKIPQLVVDADGLKLLTRIDQWWLKLPQGSVLTPHPGEMSILTSLDTKQIQSRRIEIAETYSKKWGHIVVLKGAFTVIAHPEGRSAVIPVASPALARAGTGDVLAGMIVGLVAQGIEPFNAAVAGAYIHAQAGISAAKRLGNPATILAGDLLFDVISVLAKLQMKSK